MKTTKAQIKLRTEEANAQPTRAEMMKHLDPLHKYVSYVDGDRAYWQNAEETLVFTLDCSELWRFGETNLANAMMHITELIHEARPDEVHMDKRGSKITYRMWWD